MQQSYNILVQPQGCVWPENAITSQSLASFSGISNQQKLYDVDTVVIRSCPAKCGSPTQDDQENCFDYQADRTWRCVKQEKRNQAFYYWTALTGKLSA